jgi:hypothetical protein
VDLKGRSQAILIIGFLVVLVGAPFGAFAVIYVGLSLILASIAMKLHVIIGKLEDSGGR